ncbi:hypothetical protein BHM03_00038211 [Ensete ventricosum]|nr:hypothetical protein BHM03_00038211 [Ensete ventricosum]
MFHLPSWGEEIARGRQIRRAVPDSRSYSSPLLLSPSLGCYHPKLIADSRNRPLLPHSGRRRLKSTVIGRFRVVMGWKQPQSAVLPGIGRYDSKSLTLLSTIWYDSWLTCRYDCISFLVSVSSSFASGRTS